MNITTILPQTRKAYSLIHQMTGDLGGNSHGGAIYGEITMVSMQKIVQLMKRHTKLGPGSRFIDVGCGLSKPNIHVALDPGVEFSYGIEMDVNRWILGMNNLKICLDEAIGKGQSKQNEQFLHRCILEHGNIESAKNFDPFTHVYMFDVGFPPKLLNKLSEIYNRSQSKYLICYHGEKDMIEKYGFDIELIVKVTTKMHGSRRSHTGYIYRRVSTKKNENIDLITCNGMPCDDLFHDAWIKTKKGDLQSIHEGIKQQIMIARQTSEPKRTNLQYKDLVQKPSLSLRSKIKKKKNGKSSLPLLTTKRHLQFIQKVLVTSQMLIFVHCYPYKCFDCCDCCGFFNFAMFCCIIFDFLR